MADIKLSEEAQVRRWHDRISVSKKHRDQVADKNRWNTFVEEYKGNYDIRIGDILIPPINEVFSYVDADIALISAKNPYIAVNPTKADKAKGAAILEGAVNYYWRELKIKEENDLELVDADLIGHAWHKDGHTVDTVGTGDQLKILKESLYSLRVSWRDIVFNIGSRRAPNDCLWMAQRIVRSLEETKDQYPSLSKLNGTIHPFIKEVDATQVQFKDDIMVAVLWEIWDAQHKQVYLVAEGHNKYLKQTPWPDYLDEFPFKKLAFYELPDEAYPLSPISTWEPQIIEKSKLFAMMLNHAKRWNRQMFYKTGVIPPEELNKYLLGIDGSAIKHNSANIKNDVMFADYGSVTGDFYALLDRIDRIKANVNGLPEIVQGGITKGSTRTKGELDLISAGSQNRTDRRIGKYEMYLENIARHLIAHMKANFDLEVIAKIVEETPQEVIQAFGDKFDPVSGTIRFTKEDIQGEYNVRIKAGSTLGLDKPTRMAILDRIFERAVQAQTPLPPFLAEIIIEQLRDFEMPQLRALFEQQQAQAVKEASQKQTLEEAKKAKDFADAEKRVAQSDQLDAETKLLQQEGELPIGVRSILTGLKGGPGK